MEIKIVSKEMNSTEIKVCLEKIQDWDLFDVEFKLRLANIRLRGTDPTILVAIVSAAGSAIGALLTGILSIAKERQVGKIVIQSKDGTKLEVPANVPMEKIDVLIEKVKALDIDRIEI